MKTVKTGERTCKVTDAVGCGTQQFFWLINPDRTLCSASHRTWIPPVPDRTIQQLSLSMAELSGGWAAHSHISRSL